MLVNSNLNQASEMFDNVEDDDKAQEEGENQNE